MCIWSEGRLLSVLVLKSEGKNGRRGQGVEADGLVNQWTGHKVQIGFVPKCEVTCSDLLPGALLLLTGANLALAGSGNLVALAFQHQALAEQGFW